MPKVERAILSCYDKTGIVELAKLLREFGVELISTSGTLSVLREAGIDAVSIADFTGVPELMNGRVKSLHPKVHAGLLGIRDRKLHVEHMQEYGLEWVDMVVANPLPLGDLVRRKAEAEEEIIHQIDIGGTAMIRSAAKNYRYVTVVVNPERYPLIVHELRAHEGEVSFATRRKLAEEAFRLTSAYDMTISEYLRDTSPEEK